MPSQPIPASFHWLIHTIGGPTSKGDRLQLAQFASNPQTGFSNDLGYLTVLTGHNAIRAQAVFGIVSALNFFWRLVPSGLFSSAFPDFERLARESLERHCPGIAFQPILDPLARIFRNLRNAHVQGRRSITSLDLDRIDHSQLLSTQRGRCGLCGYQFSDAELSNSFADNDEFYRVEEPRDNTEVCLERYDRKPVLDHIVPYFLGGDLRDNWQILCGSCNAGKGDSLAWLLRAGWMPVRKISDIAVLSASLRYAVLSAHLGSGTCQVPFDDELRVSRRTVESPIFFENLYAIPASRLSANQPIAN